MLSSTKKKRCGAWRRNGDLKRQLQRSAFICCHCCVALKRWLSRSKALRLSTSRNGYASEMQHRNHHFQVPFDNTARSWILDSTWGLWESSEACKGQDFSGPAWSTRPLNLQYISIKGVRSYRHSPEVAIFQKDSRLLIKLDLIRAQHESFEPEASVKEHCFRWSY